MPADVTAEADIICYWQNNHKLYPTLGHIALNILPIPVSSVSCEHLFSAAKEITDYHHAHLGPTRFEELQLMKFAWCHKICDLTAWNSAFAEEVDDLQEF